MAAVLAAGMLAGCGGSGDGAKSGSMVVIIPFIVGVIYSFTGWRGTYFAGGEHLIYSSYADSFPVIDASAAEKYYSNSNRNERYVDME